MPNLFPTTTQTITAENSNTAAEPVKFGRSVSFDFQRGEFLLTPTGKIAPCQDKEAWLEWCRKALSTTRYRHLAYSPNYGQEFDDLISRHLTREGNESEIKRMVKECLLADPRTASVSDFTFQWDGDKCYFNCTISSVREESGIISGSVVIV